MHAGHGEAAGIESAVRHDFVKDEARRPALAFAERCGDGLVQGPDGGLVHRLRRIAVQADFFVVERQIAGEIAPVPGLTGTFDGGNEIGHVIPPCFGSRSAAAV
jgi:hypothetical protein